MRRRQFLAVGCISFCPGFASAQNQTTRLIVPFPPGGATDVTARVLTEPLARILGHAVIVENRAGAGGSIGMTEVARAAPDGHTLGVATLSTHGVNPAVYKKLPYDPVKDFAPVTEVVKAPGVLLINATLPVNDLAGFVAYLKANPGKVMYASPGNGTIGHMWGELFKSTTNTFMLHIPYRGAGPAMNDLLAGQVMASFDQVASALPHIQSGKLRALAVSWSKRLDVLPNTPTYAEAGLAGNNDPSWFGLVAPSGTPATVTGRLQVAVTKALAEPAVRERLAGLGLFPTGSSPAAFRAQISYEIEKMKRIGEFAKISLDS
ncbi:MAG: tripartite tricarboxylate transporter substrate binding protein BugE [Curvibacter sp.]|jgi:tripartite-type tricarboxylate transporter receptor subunit TctC|nr:tripartite tricarboxylate transporter substrate binding protein BugE [Curvibacter sp.]